jgi:signal peptidase II
LPVSRYGVYFAIAACGCVADLVSKQLVFDWLGVAAPFVDPRDPTHFARWRGEPQLDHLWWLWKDRLGIQTSINTGALFGMGAGGWPIFATLSLLALVGIFTWLFVFRAAHDRWLTVALAFVTGGILGNLYDRLGLWNSAGLRPEYRHAVRDWILFVWREIKIPWLFDPWPNFNIADSLLVTGAIMLVVHAVLWRERPAAAEMTKVQTRMTKEAPSN